jgi:hypothetical protein
MPFLQTLTPEAISAASQSLKFRIRCANCSRTSSLSTSRRRIFTGTWTGAHFRDYHLLLDEHGDRLYAMTDDIAERARKLGGTTLRSMSDISRHQRLKDNNAEVVLPKEMLLELCRDNQEFVKFMRAAHEVCDRHNDVATASLIENWIDETSPTSGKALSHDYQKLSRSW